MNSKTLFYVLKRIGLAILTIWVVITITFFVMHAVPGGPFVGEKATTPAVQAAMEAKYGLDKPVLEQYFTYLGDIVLRFDFGPSLKQRGRQVIDIIADGMKVSAKLGLIAPSARSSWASCSARSRRCGATRSSIRSSWSSPLPSSPCPRSLRAPCS